MVLGASGPGRAGPGPDLNRCSAARCSHWNVMSDLQPQRLPAELATLRRRDAQAMRAAGPAW